MTRAGRCWTCFAVLLTTAYATTLRAQAPAGAERLTARAAADSVAALRQIDSAIARTPKDAALWFRRGMLAWTLYERDKIKPAVSGLDWVRLGYMADTSLRIAAELEPSRDEYRIMAGRFLLGAGGAPTQASSSTFAEFALEAARLSNDPRLHADAAIDAGRWEWRRYDTYSNRWMEMTEKGDCKAQTSAIAQMARADTGTGQLSQPLLSRLAQCRRPVGSKDGFSGEANYIKAEQFFREAFEALPSYERAYRQLAMLLIERNRWGELETTARARVASAPLDAWGWLTLALATHRRGGNSAITSAALDSAFKLLPPDEVQRFDHLERVLKPTDTVRFLKLDASAHDMTQSLYWKASDPLWAREGNEPHIEFLARVIYAELRWTVEELKVRGADTDRGDVYIRYGPPDAIIAGNVSGPPCSIEKKVNGIGSVWIVNQWIYFMRPRRGDPGFDFVFCGQPMYATSYVPPPKQQLFGEITAAAPVRWDNIQAIAVDSMPVQSARFRTSTDSVDLLVATLPPVASINRVAEVRTGVKSDFWVLTGTAEIISHDSLATTAPGVQTFTRRVAPGTYVYRAEASAEGARYAARAMGPVFVGPDTLTGFATRGFGLSDVLVTTTKTPRLSMRRWNDTAVAPLVGPAQRSAQLSVLWETYELGNTSGAASYDVTIALERTRGLAGRIAAQIVGNIGSAVGVDRSDDNLTMRFVRTTPWAPVIVEHIGLSLGDTPAGAYRVTVTITDHATGRTTSRSFPLLIAQ